MKIRYGYKSDIGVYRKRNEDCTAFLANNKGQFFGLVCDGLGGHRYGAIASNLARQLYQDAFTNTDFTHFTSDQDIKEWWIKTTRLVRAEMIRYAQKHVDTNDMGTTVAAVLIFNNKVYWLNIGDSRIYHYSEKERLSQLTVDQNVLNSYVRKGFEEDTATLSRTYWKALTSALGPTKSLMIDTGVYPYLNGTFLLTTDGIHDFISPEEIEAVLASKKRIGEKIDLLIQTAINNISTDNLTALIIQMID